MRGFAAQKWPTVHAHLQRSVTLSVSHTSSGVSSFALIQWSTIWRQGQQQLWQTHRSGSLLDLFPPVEWSGKEKKRDMDTWSAKQWEIQGGWEETAKPLASVNVAPFPSSTIPLPPPPSPICIMKEINFFGKHASLDVSGDPPIRHLLYTFLLMINK